MARARRNTQENQCLGCLLPTAQFKKLFEGLMTRFSSPPRGPLPQPYYSCARPVLQLGPRGRAERAGIVVKKNKAARIGIMAIYNRGAPTRVTVDARSEAAMAESLRGLEVCVRDDAKRTSRLECLIRTAPRGRDGAFPTLEDLDVLQSVLAVVGTHAPMMDVVPLFDAIGDGDDGDDGDDESGGDDGERGGRGEARGGEASTSEGVASRARLILPGDQNKNELRRNSTLSFETVAVGGTFSQFHAGHRLLLGATALVASRRVFIGIASDKLLENKAGRDKLEAYDTRAARAVAYTEAVSRGSLRGAVTAGPLTAADEPPLCATEENFDAIVVSEETVGGALWINEVRRAAGWHELVIVVVGLLLAKGDGDAGGVKISSSDLRTGDGTGDGNA